jgi:hypothetical protein
MIVVTERLGRPRWGSADFIQMKLVYPVDSDTPTATCHLLPAAEQPAYCGFPWEALVEVPGARDFNDVPENIRCTPCAGHAAADDSNP